MGTSVTPNIFDFLIKIDPFDKLPEPVLKASRIPSRSSTS